MIVPVRIMMEKESMLDMTNALRMILTVGLKEEVVQEDSKLFVMWWAGRGKFGWPREIGRNSCQCLASYLILTKWAGK